MTALFHNRGGHGDDQDSPGNSNVVYIGSGRFDSGWESEPVADREPLGRRPSRDYCPWAQMYAVGDPGAKHVHARRPDGAIPPSQNYR